MKEDITILLEVLYLLLRQGVIKAKGIYDIKPTHSGVKGFLKPGNGLIEIVEPIRGYEVYSSYTNRPFGKTLEFGSGLVEVAEPK